MCIHIPCDMPSVHTCLSAAPTCVVFRICSAMSGSAPPNATPNWRWDSCRVCIKRPIHGRGNQLAYAFGYGYDGLRRLPQNSRCFPHDKTTYTISSPVPSTQGSEPRTLAHSYPVRGLPRAQLPGHFPSHGTGLLFHAHAAFRLFLRTPPCRTHCLCQHLHGVPDRAL